jgi:Flp pilus assembly protein TadB
MDNVTNDDVSGVIESQDDELDIESVMREVRARIQSRRAEAEARALDYDALAEGRSMSADVAGVDSATQTALRSVSLGYDKISVELSLTETRVPVIGPVLQRFRSALHSVILYYLNKLAAKQIRFNEAVARSLEGLVRTLRAGARQDDVDALRAEIERLQERVDTLETRLQK